MEENLEKLEQQGNAIDDSLPIAAFHPTMGLISVPKSDELEKKGFSSKGREKVQIPFSKVTMTSAGM